VTRTKTKTCSKCNRELGFGEFTRHQWYRKPDDQRACKECYTPETPLVKRCGRCDRELESDKFTQYHWHKQRDDQRVCRTCRPPNSRSSRRIVPGGVYRCSKCGRDNLPASEFYPNRTAKDGTRLLHSRCIRCLNPGAGKRLDMAYDYRFARDILGWGDEKIRQWLADGYGEDNPEGLFAGGAAAIDDDWEPDPYREVT